MISLHIQRQTWAHKLPARVKLGLLLLAGAAILPIGDLRLLAGLLAAVLAAYASLGRDGLKQLASMRALALLVLLLLAFHVLTGSLEQGAIVVGRLLVMVLAANFVTATTRMDDMLEAIRPLFVPLKLIGISPRRPALALTLVLRFVPVLLEIHARLREAYRARTGKRSSWRLIAPLTLQSLQMSTHVAEALSARGGVDGLAVNRPGGRPATRER